MSTIPLFYAGGGNAKIVGSVTGTTYLFLKGESVDVFLEDAEDLLTKIKVTQCCGYKETGRVVHTQLFVKG